MSTRWESEIKNLKEDFQNPEQIEFINQQNSNFSISHGREGHRSWRLYFYIEGYDLTRP
jgi:hypothetical protein